MSKEPLTIADFRKIWSFILSKEEEAKHMPLHPFGSFRINPNGNNPACKACHFYTKGSSQFKYSSICYGRRRFFLFRLLCSKQPHYHVKCKECGAVWFESMESQ